VFQGFRQAKSANGGSILSSSHFLVLPQLPQKMELASKVVKVDSKIIISLPKIQIPETHCMFIDFRLVYYHKQSSVSYFDLEDICNNFNYKFLVNIKFENFLS
jgi:hypothetical protein